MRRGDLVYVTARVARWVSDEPFPGVIEVEVEDFFGKTWSFVDKTAMFTRDVAVVSGGPYPIPIELGCVVLESMSDRVKVSTTSPWGLESVDGTSEFVFGVDQVNAIAN